MNWKKVRSANIRAIGYDQTSNTLAVRFASGTIYHYADVPEQKHSDLLSASSHGSFLHAHIKPHHVATKQEQEKDDDGKED